MCNVANFSFRLSIDLNVFPVQKCAPVVWSHVHSVLKSENQGKSVNSTFINEIRFKCINNLTCSLRVTIKPSVWMMCKNNWLYVHDSYLSDLKKLLPLCLNYVCEKILKNRKFTKAVWVTQSNSLLPVTLLFGRIRIKYYYLYKY